MTQQLDLTQKPNDTSGATSGNRFSFQIDWAFSKLIELHRKGKEYLIFLDIHDDVVVADSETAPSTVDFYQVKTSKKKEWTEARLTYRTNGKSLSILGKLYAHKLSFPSNSGVAVFVSNRHCGLEAPAKFNGAPEVFFADLDPSCKQRLVAKIRKEHNLATDPDCDKFIQFYISDLHVDEHSRDVQGALVEFTDSIAPGDAFNVPALYRTIAQWMRRRNDHEEVPNTLADLIKKKAIGRSEVQRVLDNMRPINRYSQLWSQIDSADFGPNFGLRDKKRIREGFGRYAAHKLDPGNAIAQNLGQAIRIAMNGVNDFTTLTQLFALLMPHLPKPSESLPVDYIKGAIVLEFYDNVTEQLPSPDPKSEGAPA